MLKASWFSKKSLLYSVHFVWWRACVCLTSFTCHIWALCSAIILWTTAALDNRCISWQMPPLAAIIPLISRVWLPLFKPSGNMLLTYDEHIVDLYCLVLDTWRISSACWIQLWELFFLCGSCEVNGVPGLLVFSS